MSMRSKFFSFCLFLFVNVSFEAFAQGQVRAMLDSADILPGDEIRLRVEVTVPKEHRLVRIGTDTLAVVKGLERRRALVRDSVVGEEGISYAQDFVLSAFDSGYYRLPPIPLEVEGPSGTYPLYSNTLGFKVRPIPIATDTARLQPIKGIWKEPVGISDIWPYLLVLPLILLVLWLFRRRRRKKAEAPVEESPAVPILPPHIAALEQLAALKEKALLEQQEYKRYQSELSHIFKEYISRRYEVQALESVTEEVLDLLRGAGTPERWKNVALQVLRDADLVKFAKADLPRERHEASWQAVVDFVEATKLELKDGDME